VGDRGAALQAGSPTAYHIHACPALSLSHSPVPSQLTLLHAARHSHQPILNVAQLAAAAGDVVCTRGKRGRGEAMRPLGVAMAAARRGQVHTALGAGRSVRASGKRYGALLHYMQRQHADARSSAVNKRGGNSSNRENQWQAERSYSVALNGPTHTALPSALPGTAPAGRGACGACPVSTGHGSVTTDQLCAKGWAMWCSVKRLPNPLQQRTGGKQWCCSGSGVE